MQKLILSFGIVLIVLGSCKKDPVMTTGTYFPQVRTIIQTNCVECHQPNAAGLPTRLDSDDYIANDYAAIKAAVIDPVSVTNKRMPQGSALSQADIDIIQKWYDKGGKKTD